MGFFEEQLGNLADADARRFAGGSFADDRLGSVAGAVRRRRAARAAGVGGVSVVGASALAMGGANLPWSSVGLGFAPAATGTVVCTTTTPGTTANFPLSAPAGAQMAVVDRRDDEVTFVGLVDGESAAWSSAGDTVPLTRDEGFDGYATLELAAGGQVVVRSDGEHVSAVAADDRVVPMAVDAYLLVVTNGPWGGGVELAKHADPGTSEVDGGAPARGTWDVLSRSGEQIGQLVLGASTLTLATDSSVQTITLRDGQLYNFDLPGGGKAAFTVTDREASVANPGLFPLADEPVTTCVTTTPEPSLSSAPSTPPSPTSAPSASTSQDASPFECGFSFPEDSFGSDELSITGGLTTEADIRSTLLEWYGNQAPTTEVENSNAPAYRASVEYEVAGYAAGVLDPVRVFESDKAFGFAFVAVRDGVVVGTIEPESDGTTYGMVEDRDGSSAPVQAFLWDRAAFTPCGTASIEDAEIYAVAGAKEGDEATYGWARMTQ